jgi:hypothetical protein
VGAPAIAGAPTPSQTSGLFGWAGRGKELAVDVRGSASDSWPGVKTFMNLAASAVAGMIWSVLSSSAALGTELAYRGAMLGLRRPLALLSGRRP